MAKCETFNSKQTNWLGLWWHPEINGFSSSAINLSQLKKFKGVVRLYVRKNKFFNKGENGRPNYCFCIKDTNSEIFREIEVCDEQKQPYFDDGTYYTEDGERLYTYSEVQHAINCAAIDGAREYGYGENLVEDYL